MQAGKLAERLASVAQRQSNGFVNRRLWVQIPPLAFFIICDVAPMSSSIVDSNLGQLKEYIARHYDELHAIALQEAARERPDNSLQASAIINEVVIKLLEAEATPQFNDSNHFLATCRLMMKRKYIDVARARAGQAHGGNMNRHRLHENIEDSPEQCAILELYSEELEKLQAVNPKYSNVIVLRAMGYTWEEIAAKLNISRTEAYNLYLFTKAWLLSEVKKNESNEN
jgi:RNA polymerase sigma factor (TIGR02999 family)